MVRIALCPFPFSRFGGLSMILFHLPIGSIDYGDYFQRFYPKMGRWVSVVKLKDRDDAREAIHRIGETKLEYRIIRRNPDGNEDLVLI